MIRVHPGMLRLVGLYCAFTDFCMGRKETERTDTERKKQQKNALLFNWAKCVWFIESVWHGNSQDGRLHGLQGLENVWSAEGIVTAPAALLESDIQLKRAPGCSSWKRTFRRWAKSHQPNEGKLWKKIKKADTKKLKNEVTLYGPAKQKSTAAVLSTATKSIMQL